MCELLFLVADS